MVEAGRHVCEQRPKRCTRSEGVAHEVDPKAFVIIVESNGGDRRRLSFAGRYKSDVRDRR
ncbi:MAG: hypothetical protein ACLTSZ_14780 [Lachnospiraceae bacterium]